MLYPGFTGRLRNPMADIRSGVYEMSHYDTYGRVITTMSDAINSPIAEVICRSLGYDDGVLLPGQQFQVTEDVFSWLEVKSCSGSETDITQCVAPDGITAKSGDRTRDVAAVCYMNADTYGNKY